MARPSFFVEFLFQPFRITGRCLTFFPICRRSSAKTTSGVYSKNPMPFFQLIPQQQCCKPMNCCSIFRPQFGQTLLLAPMLFLVPQPNVLNEKLEVIPIKSSFVAADRNAFQIIFSGQFQLNDSVMCAGFPKTNRFVDTICSSAGILKIVVQTGYSVHLKRAIQQ